MWSESIYNVLVKFALVGSNKQQHTKLSSLEGNGKPG